MLFGKLPKCFICTLPRGGTWFWWLCCLQQAQPLLQGRQRARHRAGPAPVEPTSSFPFCSAKLSAPKGTLWGLWQALQIAGSVVRGDKGPGEHQARGRWVKASRGGLQMGGSRQDLGSDKAGNPEGLAPSGRLEDVLGASPFLSLCLRNPRGQRDGGTQSPAAGEAPLGGLCVPPAPLLRGLPWDRSRIPPRGMAAHEQDGQHIALQVSGELWDLQERG